MIAHAALLLCSLTGAATEVRVLGLGFTVDELAHPLPAIEARVREIVPRAHAEGAWANFTAGAPRELYEAAVLAARTSAADRATMARWATTVERDPERTLWGLLAGEAPAWDRMLDGIVGDNFPLYHKELVWAFAPVVEAMPQAARDHLLARLPALYARAVELSRLYGEVTKAPKRALDALARIVVAPDRVFTRALSRKKSARSAYAEALRRMGDATLPAEVHRVTVDDIVYLASILPAEMGAEARPILFGSFVNGQADPRRSDIDVADPADVRQSLPRTNAAIRARFGAAGEGKPLALAIDDEGKLLYNRGASGVYNTFYVAVERGRAVLCVTSFAGYAMDHDEKPIFTTTRHPL